MCAIGGKPILAPGLWPDIAINLCTEVATIYLCTYVPVHVPLLFTLAVASYVHIGELSKYVHVHTVICVCLRSLTFAPAYLCTYLYMRVLQTQGGNTVVGGMYVYHLLLDCMYIYVFCPVKRDPLFCCSAVCCC